MRIKRSPRFFIYLSALLLSFYYAFVLYINSTFLGLYLTPQTISLLYILSSILSLILLSLSPNLVKKYGNYRVTLSFIIVQAISLMGLVFTRNIWILSSLFIVVDSMPVLVLFSLDLYLEKATKNNFTGHARSMYMTVQNVAVAISPLIVGIIISTTGYRSIYLISTGFVLILFFVVQHSFKKIEIRSFKEANFVDAYRKFLPRKDLISIFISDMMLQLFYVIMVIYTPLYLHTVVNFEWKNIGLIFSIMLLPFVLFEVPLGRGFDRLGNEKNALWAGFLIMGTSTLVIASLTYPSVAVWMIILFVSRIGASLVEIGNESYFFKHVDSRDAGFISLFRTTIAISYIVGPIIATIIFTVGSYQTLFTTLGVLMLLGMLTSFKLKKSIIERS